MRPEVALLAEENARHFRLGCPGLPDFGEAFTMCSKWKKWTRRPKVPVPTKPPELVEGENIDLWFHSFVDCFTWKVVSTVVDAEDLRASLAAGKVARTSDLTS